MLAQHADPVSRDRYGRTTALCLGLLIVALWLATRPYRGIVHDSRFYTVQALSALIPGRFEADLYFQYGSQDQFTLFTRIYEPFLATFGIAGGNLVLLILAQSFWLIGLIYLAHSLFRDGKMVLIAVAAVVVLPGGAAIMFRYGEAFLTPRLFAEALTFWALGAMLRGSSIRAILLLCVSIAIHPLMTLPGVVILFFFEAGRRPALWLVVAIAAMAIPALAFSGIQPFARLLVSFDPAWLATVRVRNSYCLPTQWGLEEWLPDCNILALAILVLSTAEPDERRFVGTVLAVALGGVVISIIGGDLVHNVLVVDIQLWRATWLLAVAVHLLVGPMLLRVQRRGESLFTIANFLTALTLGLFALSGFLSAISIPVAPTAVVAWLVGAWERAKGRPIKVGIRILVLAFVGGVLGLTFVVVYVSFVDLAFTPPALRQTLCGIALAASASSAIWLHAAATKPRKWVSHPAAMLCLAVALVTLAGFNWDQRTPWTKFVDTTEAPPVSLASSLPGDLPVYWEDVTAPWFLLKRSSYFSCEQGTGVLFSRGTAINYQRRYESFRALRTLDFGHDPYCLPADGDATAPLSRDDLSSVCKKEPGLGALVLTKAVPGVPEWIWVSPVKFQDVRALEARSRLFSTDRFFVYSCADLR